MTALRGDRQDRARRRRSASHITFPEGLTIAEMAKIFEASGFGRPRRSSRPRRTRRSIARSRSRGAGSRGLSVSRKPTRCRAAPTPRVSCASMVDRFEQVLTPELRAGGRGARAVGAAARDAGVDRREGNGTARGAAARGGGVRQPAADRDGAAVRPDGDLRAAARREVQRQSAPGRSRVRLARTTPIATRACRRARSRRRARRRSRRAAHPADVDYLYFVSRNDGSHEFARTLDEHNRNVQKYQVQYFRERVQTERRGGSEGRRVRSQAESAAGFRRSDWP